MAVKEKTILETYANAKSKKNFCSGLAKLLDRKGFGKQNWFSIQSNQFSRGILPSMEILINIYYEYAKGYQDPISGQTEKKTESGKVVPQASDKQ
jgi:hypothetical protein